MRRPNDEWAAQVTAILEKHGIGDKPMSFRTAERRTDFKVSHATIGSWTQGKIPRDPDFVRHFADGLRERRTDLLRAAGYGVTEDDEEWDRTHYPPDQAFAEKMAPFGPSLPLGSIPLANGTLPMDFPRHRDGERYEDMRALAVEGVMAIFAAGDSMTPKYDNGDLVFVMPLPGEPKVGETYAILVDGEPTCKTLAEISEDEDEEYRRIYRFEAINSRYPPITISEDRVRFQGIPIGSISWKNLAKARRAMEALEG